MTDPVNSPKHYNTGKIEVIEAIEDWKLGFHEGSVVKYVARAKHKGSELEDLKKAAWYLNRAIENLEKQPNPTGGSYLFAAHPLIHAYFSQNYAGTACGETGTSSETDSDVTCEKCNAWLKRKASREAIVPVHYVKASDEPALCGSFGNDQTTSDPEWVTCEACRATLKPVKTIHIIDPRSLPGGIGVCGVPIMTCAEGTHDTEAATCIKCKELAAEPIHLWKSTELVWCGAKATPEYVIDVPTLATCKKCRSLFNATLRTP